MAAQVCSDQHVHLPDGIVFFAIQLGNGPIHFKQRRYYNVQFNVNWILPLSP